MRRTVRSLVAVGAALGAVRYRKALGQAWRHRSAARTRWDAIKPTMGAGRAQLAQALRDAPTWQERRVVIANSAAMTRALAGQLFAPPDGE